MRRGILSSGCKDTTFFNRIGIVLAFKKTRTSFFGNTYMFFEKLVRVFLRGIM